VGDVHLPPTLPPLFPGLTRRLELEAGTIRELLDTLKAQWPGLCDRVYEPGPKPRRHIHIFAYGERAELDTVIAAKARVDVVTAVSGGMRLVPSGTGRWLRTLPLPTITPARPGGPRRRSGCASNGRAVDVSLSDDGN
jgi:sulfur-carrier protein